MKIYNLVYGVLVIIIIAAGVTGCFYDKTVIIEDSIVDVPDDLSFSKDVMPLFNLSCNVSGCHNTGGTPPDLTSANAYNALIKGNFINKDAPEQSDLYLWITGKKSLPMPLTGPDAKINSTVLAWIKKGAPNN